MAPPRFDSGQSPTRDPEPTVILPMPFMSRTAMLDLRTMSPDLPDEIRVQFNLDTPSIYSDHYTAYAATLTGDGFAQAGQVELPDPISFLPLNPLFTAVMIEEWVETTGLAYEWPAEQYYLEHDLGQCPGWERDNWIKVFEGEEPPDQLPPEIPDPLTVREYNQLFKLRSDTTEAWWCKCVSMRNRTDPIVKRAKGTDVTQYVTLNPLTGEILIDATLNIGDNVGKTILMCVQAIYAQVSSFSIIVYGVGAQDSANDWVVPPGPGTPNVIAQIDWTDMSTGWVQLPTTEAWAYQDWVGWWAQPVWSGRYGACRQIAASSGAPAGATLTVVSVVGNMAVVNADLVWFGNTSLMSILQWQDPATQATAPIVSGGDPGDDQNIMLAPGVNHLVAFGTQDHRCLDVGKATQFQKCLRSGQAQVTETVVLPHTGPYAYDWVDPTCDFISAPVGIPDEGGDPFFFLN